MEFVDLIIKNNQIELEILNNRENNIVFNIYFKFLKENVISSLLEDSGMGNDILVEDICVEDILKYRQKVD